MYHSLFDGEGSVVKVVDGAGNAVASYFSCPTGNDADPPSGADMGQPWRHWGLYYELGTKDYLLGGMRVDSNSGNAAQAYDSSYTGPMLLASALVDPGGGGSPLVFRGMIMAPDGGPLVPSVFAGTARSLGARVPADILTPEGYVFPNTGGISVAPTTPYNLPDIRRPPEWGGIGKDPVWAIDISQLPSGLKYVQDSPKHGTIQRAYPMEFGDYQRLLASTRGLWFLYPPPGP